MQADLLSFRLKLDDYPGHAVLQIPYKLHLPFSEYQSFENWLPKRGLRKLGVKFRNFYRNPNLR